MLINGLGKKNDYTLFIRTDKKGEKDAIETATMNAKAAYTATGYFPNPGSTQVWSLGEELLPLIKKGLEQLKHRFPAPVIV